MVGFGDLSPARQRAGLPHQLVPRGVAPGFDPGRVYRSLRAAGARCAIPLGGRRAPARPLKGFKIIGIDNNFRKFFFGRDGDINPIKNRLKKTCSDYYHFNSDIRKYNNLKKIFQKYKKDIKIIIHTAAQPSHDWAKDKPFIDFDINAKGTLNLLELTRLYCPKAPFIFMSTNKIYGDNPNSLPLIEKKTRWEIKNSHPFSSGIDESMSIDNCTHSFFGVSKSYADLIVQEYGINVGLKTACFRAGCITGPNHA